MIDCAPGNDLMAVEQRFRLPPAMGLDHAHRHVDAGLQALHAVDQHLIGLADARRRAEEYLQTPAAFPRRLTQIGFWIAAVRFAHPA